MPMVTFTTGIFKITKSQVKANIRLQMEIFTKELLRKEKEADMD